MTHPENPTQPEVQHGRQPEGKDPEVQHGSQPAPQEGDTIGVVPVYAGGEESPEADPQPAESDTDDDADADDADADADPHTD